MSTSRSYARIAAVAMATQAIVCTEDSSKQGHIRRLDCLYAKTDLKNMFDEHNEYTITRIIIRTAY